MLKYPLRYHRKLIFSIAKRARLLFSAFKQFAGTTYFGKLYLLAAWAVLTITTYIWVTLGAVLQNSNADQLVNTYLFQNPHNLSNAVLPSAHSFLIKWPLYFFIKVFGSSSTALTVLTVLTVLATVGALVFILSRIEKRPMVLGTIILFLASALLLVPTVPYPGNLLPVNMAMLATRNLEYVVYIGALWLIIKYPRFKDWRLWAGLCLLSLVIASDKLFLSLSLGGALAMLIIYSLASGWNLVSLSAKWLVGTLISGLAAIALLQWLSLTKVTHFIAGGGALGPYDTVRSAHDFVLAAAYAVLGLLTNFGANPAFQTTMLHQIPYQTLSHLISLAGPAFLINLLFLGYGLYCAGRLIVHSLRHNKNREVVLEDHQKLALLLLFSVAAALGAFILSNHYYAGDARYLTIGLFAVFITVASYARQTQWRSWRLGLAGIVTLLGILLAIPAVTGSYSANRAALANVNHRNKLVAEAIGRHRVDVLVGDYWRVIPAKFASHHKVNIMPLANCTDVRTTLTSTAWKYDLKKNSFAYLLSLDRSLTDFPQCNLDQIIKTYGRPNSSIVIDGTFSQPKEVLLFYDSGAVNSAPIAPPPQSGPSTVVPVSIDEFPYRACDVPTVLNVIAHQDDDLLFMNPDLTADIRQGHCIRSIYITAGDAGGGMFYWLSRQQGTESAYSKLSGSDETWVERIVRLRDNQFVVIANPRGNSKISLVFMYLPDGNLRGQGFPATKYQSLEKLDRGSIGSIDSVYLNSHFSSPDLQSALTELMHLYQPTEIRTQSNYAGSQFTDHSDHMTTGRFTARAYKAYVDKQYEGKITVPLTFYLGYPGHEFPPNVEGADLEQKEQTFYEYSRFDGGVCRSIAQCIRDPAYGAYLTRQYRSAY